MNSRFVAIAFVAVALAGATETGIEPAQAASRPVRQCFFSDRILNWTSVDDSVINLRAEGGKVFQLKLRGSCPGLATHSTLVFDTGMSREACDGRDVNVVVASGIGPMRCSVETLRLLNPDEIAALPKRARP